MKRTYVALLILATGCNGVQEGLQKVTIIEYDQVTNFSTWRFDDPVTVGPDGAQAKNMFADGGAFWATFVICSIRNEGTQAVAFPFDVSAFSVPFGGSQHVYAIPAPPPFSLDGGGATPNVDETLAAQAFRADTRIGADQLTYAPGFHAVANQRFAMLVQPGDGTGMRGDSCSTTTPSLRCWSAVTTTRRSSIRVSQQSSTESVVRLRKWPSSKRSGRRIAARTGSGSFDVETCKSRGQQLCSKLSFFLLLIVFLEQTFTRRVKPAQARVE